MVNIKINGIPLSVPTGTRIIDAAAKLGIDIPHLCYHPDQRIKALCRVCSVEVVGRRKMVAACSTEVYEGLEIKTNSAKCFEAQKTILELILANHNQDCLNCQRNGSCELQDLVARFGIKEQQLTNYIDDSHPDSSLALYRDSTKCVKCGRCAKICKDIQGVNALSWAYRSADMRFTTAYDSQLADTGCVLCGQCASVCPVGAINERDDTAKVWAAIHDERKHVIVQSAPAVRVALGDEFGMDSGTITTGKMVTALKALGFDKVFDTCFSADITIWEEATELLKRVEKDGTLPMITSCCPGWVNFAEKHYPEVLSNLSTTRSPQQIFGAVAKEYYPELIGREKKDIVSVSIMPCTAKKYEANRPEMTRGSVPDVDYVLTTRELAKMIKRLGLDFKNLPDSEFDNPLGESTGAAVIFGKTGGVMEAALRMATEKLTGQTVMNLAFEPLAENENIHVAELDLGKGKIVKAAITSGLKNAAYLMDEVKNGTSPYTFIEIMACPDGCIGGGGQPRSQRAKILKRLNALNDLDESMPLRRSQDNKSVHHLYDTFVGKPCGKKAHELFHTHYKASARHYDFSRFKY